MKGILAKALICVLCASVVSMFAPSIISARATATLIVPDNYATIQSAINAASNGDTIFVRNGTYHESLIDVSKTLSLVGEGKQTTILDGGSSDHVIVISANNVSVTGFTLQNSYGYDVVLSRASYCTITQNNMAAGSSGNCIALFNNSNYNIISGNNITGLLIGVFLRYSCQNNTIVGNEIVNCGSSSTLSGGIGFMDGSDQNTIYHNNFVNNIWPVHSNLPTNVWDNGYPPGGNYWSNYNGIDVKSGSYQNQSGSDGIGDTPFSVSPGFTGAVVTDNYPLMVPLPLSAGAIALTPQTGFASTTITGSGFTATSRITITWDGTTIPSVPNPPITDASGSFAALISVPTQTAPGMHTVNATDGFGNWAIATFNVIDMTGPKGDTGQQGATGAQGVNGTKGDKGDQGPPGNMQDILAVVALPTIVSVLAICLATVAILKKRS